MSHTIEETKKHNKEHWQWLKDQPSNSARDKIIVERVLTSVDFDIFIDCGPGVIGSEAWTINAQCPNIEIIGFEPQKARYEMLKNSQYPGALYNQCVSATTGTVKGFTGHIEGKSDFVLRTSQSDIDAGFYKPVLMDSTTIDTILATRPDASAFIWADIEGAEGDMLRGAVESLKKGKIKGLVLELHNPTSPSFHRGDIRPDFIHTILEKVGFTKIHLRGSPTHSDWLYIQKEKKN